MTSATTRIILQNLMLMHDRQRAIQTCLHILFGIVD